MQADSTGTFGRAKDKYMKEEENYRTPGKTREVEGSGELSEMFNEIHSVGRDKVIDQSMQMNRN